MEELESSIKPLERQRTSRFGFGFSKRRHSNDGKDEDKKLNVREYKCINELKKRTSPLRPLDLITHNFAYNDHINIIRADLENGKGPDGNASIEMKESINSQEDCENLLEQLNDHQNFPPDEKRTIMLLVEDISLATVDFLCGSLKIPPSFLLDYARGVRGMTFEALKAFLRIPDDYDPMAHDPSLRHRWAREFKVLRRRNIAHEDDAIVHIDWTRVFFMENRVSDKENWTVAAENEKYGTTALYGKKPGEGDRRIWEYNDFQKHGFHRQSRIYRPSFKISIDIPYTRTEAAEERFSRITRNFNGHKIMVYMFDPDRTILTREGKKEFDVYYGVGERMTPTPRDEYEPEPMVNGRYQVKTTRDIYVDFLEHWCEKGTLESLDVCEIHFFRGILSEYSDTLAIMEEALNQIDYIVADATEIQKSIREWEILFSKLRLVLGDMTGSIKAMEQSMALMDWKQEGFNDPEFTKESRKTLRAMNEFSEYQTQILSRMERIFQALMSTMSIIESQEAVNEASSVGKLTELAFLFIPLTFAATFYSMQVESLNPTISKFCIMAAILLVVSYGARILIRSRLKQKFQSKMKLPIYASGAVPRGQKIPAGTYSTFYLGKLGRMFSRYQGLAFIACLSLALPLIWTKGKTLRFRITATLFSIITGFIVGHDSKYLEFWRSRSLEKTYLILGVYGILIVSMETNLETAVKISICSGIVTWITPSHLAMASISRWVFYFESWTFMPICFGSFFLAPTILFWYPWSKQPDLELWERSACTVAFFLASLLWSPGLCFYHLRLRWQTFNFIFKVILRLSVILVLPVVITWTYGYPDHTIPKVAQIMITVVNVWISVVLVWIYGTYTNRWGFRERGPKRTAFAACLGGIAAGAFCAILPLMIWIGNLESLEKMSDGAKIALTVVWVFVWCIFGGFCVTVEPWLDLKVKFTTWKFKRRLRKVTKASEVNASNSV